MYSLDGKIIVITGASSGIGKALGADALARGANIAVCGRDVDKLKNAFREVDHSRILFFKADVSKENDCKMFVDTVLKQWGKVDVLINNAGITMRALFEELNIDVLKELMNVNYWGSVYCTKFSLPSIMHNSGIIVGISSVAGYRGLPGRTGYSASKFALQGFLEALRTELLHTGVNVMWVSPGFTASNIRNTARANDGSLQGETPIDESKLMSAEECARHILNAIQKRKRSIVLTFQGKLAVWLNKLFPSIADKLVYRHFLRETDSPLKKYGKTN